MARSVQEITSFTLVSLIIIIHNVINNKVFLYTGFDESTHLNHCTAIHSTGVLILSLLSNCRYLQFNW